jgi:hypothetical protein
VPIANLHLVVIVLVIRVVIYQSLRAGVFDLASGNVEMNNGWCLSLGYAGWVRVL